MDLRNSSCASRAATILALAMASSQVFAAGSDQSNQQASNVPVMGLTGLTSLSQFGHVVINPAATPGRTLSVLPLNAPPINGFNPQVVFGLSNEQDRNDTTFESRASSTPGGNYV